VPRQTTKAIQSCFPGCAPFRSPELSSFSPRPTRQLSHFCQLVVMFLRGVVKTRLAVSHCHWHAETKQASSLRLIFREEESEIKMGRQPRSGDVSLAIGPFDPDWDRR